MYMYMYICVYVYMCICVYVYMCIWTVYVYMRIRVYVYMCICICVILCTDIDSFLQLMFEDVWSRWMPSAAGWGEFLFRWLWRQWRRSETSFVHCCCRHFPRVWEGLLLRVSKEMVLWLRRKLFQQDFLLLIHPIFQIWGNLVAWLWLSCEEISKKFSQVFSWMVFHVEWDGLSWFHCYG